MSRDEGGYVTRGRAAALERQMVKLEERLTSRMDRLERELAGARSLPLDVLREQTRAMLEVFSRHTRGAAP